MSNTAPEQLDLTQPIDRVVKQIVDLATAEREAKGWWQAILRLVPKEHHEPADAVRYIEERLNAWGGLLATAGFKQDDGARAAQHLTDEVRAYARLRGGLVLRLGAPRGAADAVLLERLNDLASHAHGVESLRELNAGLKAQLEEARPKAEMWDALKRGLDDVPDNDVVPQVAEARKALSDIGDALGFSRMERPYRVSDEAVQRLRVARAKQDLLDGWAQVARLLCGDAASLEDLEDVPGVVAAAQKQRDELTKAQALIDQWDMQYQDLRDKVADFHTQISRALGVEPLSLTADEMLRRINEGAVAWRAHERLVEALHIGRPASAVSPDELVAWTYAHRALVDRLTAALRRHTPFESVEELCNLLENGRIAEMIRRSDAWECLIKAYNEELSADDVPFLTSNAKDSVKRLALTIKRGARLLTWMREQAKTEAKG